MPAEEQLFFFYFFENLKYSANCQISPFAIPSEMLSIYQEKHLEFHNMHLWSVKSHELLIATDLYKNQVVWNQSELEKLDHFRLGNETENCRVTVQRFYHIQVAEKQEDKRLCLDFSDILGQHKLFSTPLETLPFLNNTCK